MITLITGAPGAGKSAALVELLSTVFKDRPTFVNGVPELKLPHTDLSDLNHWPEVVPDGSLVVGDEAQKYWRPMGPGQKPPAAITDLETHRHRALDFVLITQGPKLLHSNVRALVGRHIHLRDLGWLGRWWYEWPECNDNCANAWKNAPIKKRYKLPKAIFGQYKSATEHIKPVRSFPWMVVLLIAGLFGTAGLAYWAYTRVVARNASVAPVTSPASTASPGSASNAAAAPPVAKFVDDRVDFIPRMTIKPESAPAYDSLRVVVAMPVVSGGICRGSTCKCVTQQGTDTGLTSDDCKAWMENRPFNPYAKPDAAVEALNRPDGRMPLSGNSTGEAPARPIDVLPYSGPSRVGESAKSPQQARLGNSLSESGCRRKQA